MTNHPDDERLGSMLRGLREAESGDAAPPHVEAAVMRAWDASHAAPGPRHRLAAVSRFAALAAGVVLAVGVAALAGRLRSVTAEPPSPLADAPPTVVLVGEPILDGEHVRLVRMRMPASTLHALGVRSTAAPAGDVDVDVVVGEDGVARALSLNP
jgi:hypothetical protein